MKILAVADEESKSLWDYYTPDKLEDVDLIISCGDLKATYLEFLVTMAHCPVLYVPGNHDKRYVQDPPGGCINIDGKLYVHNGVRIIGFGGCMKYGGGPYMYTEEEMRRKIWKSKGQIVSHGGIDILVAHAAAKGYGDLKDLPHQGFECFDDLLCRTKPTYFLHGHVHQSYTNRNFKRETEHSGGTRIVNAYDRYYFDFDPEKDKNKLNFFHLTKNLLGFHA